MMLESVFPQHVQKTTIQYDLAAIREDFPILKRTIHGKPLVYLDNAASTQKPRVVIDAIRHVYEGHYANVHRGVHTLSQECTTLFEESRKKVQRFLHAKHAHEIVFVRGATEGINLIASTYGRTYVNAGDEILITAMEHHSNIVPWQCLAKEKGAILKVVPMNNRGELCLEEYAGLLSERTKLVSIVHMSNALGTINPVSDMIRLAHEQDIPVLLDGAQSISHLPVNVQSVDCDFFVLSGHKVYGPSGIGVLYGKEEWLKKIPPYQGGGDMIRTVTFEKSEYNELPYKFEAGTPSIADAISLGAALEYVETIGLSAIAEHEHQLLNYATEKAQAIPGLRLIGTAAQKGAILSFTLERIHPHDIGTILDHLGVAVRAGHHCAMPVMDFFGVPATVRASFGLYNTLEEVDTLIEGIYETIKLFR